ncbi:unnamed protein product [Caenorhabditis bovis]|uniref:Uncharacterized protein n=1 Tax=Caenorhabditis bovis TaxID=2654633 RepID=A0A8S1FG25_9PELO|nr:unnamed protein product [Caenorhabditis bovis]
MLQFEGVDSTILCVQLDRNIDDLENSILINVEKLVSVFIHNAELHFVNRDGVICRIDGDHCTRLLRCSPLLLPVLSATVIEQRFMLISPKFLASFAIDFPLDYETYELNAILTNGKIAKFGENRLIVFERKSQICWIWDAAKPSSPSHQLVFDGDENTVDLVCDNDNLYTLTNNGIISTWVLQENGRKYRGNLFNTGLLDCLQLLMAFPKKFVVQTVNAIHFLVFAPDEQATSG